MRSTPTFDVSEANAEAVLCCPHCGHNYTHHDTITIYSRPHEDGAVRLTKVYGNGDTRVQSGLGEGVNPSSRRDALAVEIYCEGCDGRAELTIAQHKGQTCLQLRSVVTP